MVDFHLKWGQSEKSIAFSGLSIGEATPWDLSLVPAPSSLRQSSFQLDAKSTIHFVPSLPTWPRRALMLKGRQQRHNCCKLLENEICNRCIPNLEFSSTATSYLLVQFSLFRAFWQQRDKWSETYFTVFLSNG